MSYYYNEEKSLFCRKHPNHFILLCCILVLTKASVMVRGAPEIKQSIILKAKYQ